MTEEDTKSLVLKYRDEICGIFSRYDVLNMRYLVSQIAEDDYVPNFLVEFSRPNLFKRIGLTFEIRDLFGIPSLIPTEESANPEVLPGILERARPL